MIIAFTSFKGGVGKTTLSENIAVGLANLKAKHSVCILDADETGNSAAWGKLRSEDKTLVNIDIFTETNKEEIPFTIEKLNKKYDFVIIDSPPSKDPISDAIIIMSNLVISPITPKGHQEINTINQFIRKVKAIEIMRDKNIPLFFAINLHDKGKPKQLGVIEEMRKMFGARVIPTVIRNLAGYEDATFEGKGAYEYTSREARNEMVNFINNILAIVRIILNPPTEPEPTSKFRDKNKSNHGE